MSNARYSSIPDTLAHQRRVVDLMRVVVDELHHRAVHHDDSKMESPEVEVFDRFTPELREQPYGSEGYYANLEAMKAGLDHHFAHNDHHPQHHERGVAGMNLMQMTEMLVDWRASTERNPEGNLRRSLEINARRFSIPGPILDVLHATARDLGWLEPEK